jgi:hypothetical protein
MIGLGFRHRIKHAQPVLGFGDEGVNLPATQGIVP